MLSVTYVLPGQPHQQFIYPAVFSLKTLLNGGKTCNLRALTLLESGSD